MKNIYLIIVTLFLIINGYSQVIDPPQQIIDIEDYSGFKTSIEDAYYKDINNYFNPFMGTWFYTSPDGLTTFKIVLYKELELYTGKFYTDYVSGEYHYSDGSMDVNTLSNTDTNNPSIWGKIIINSNNRPYCPDCISGEKRLSLSISDRERDLHGDFTLRLITVNGQPAIEGLIFGGGPTTYNVANPPPYLKMRIPTGTFVFIKQ